MAVALEGISITGNKPNVKMVVTSQNIVTTGAVLVALLAIFDYYNNGYKRYLKILEQEKAIKEIKWE